eukprot:jgi/Mesvir1/6732/Mv04437-RA.1
MHTCDVDFVQQTAITEPLDLSPFQTECKESRQRDLDPDRTSASGCLTARRIELLHQLASFALAMALKLASSMINIFGRLPCKPPHYVGSQARIFSINARAMSSDISGSGGIGGVSLVQGSSRGIGLEFVRQLLERPQGQVVATCRNPEKATALQDLANSYPSRLDIVRIDVTDEQSVKDAACHVRGKHGRLDLLVNSTGILKVEELGMSPETALSRINVDHAIMSYRVNALGPLLMMREFEELLAKGGGEGTGRAGAVVANLSARVGSITDNALGGWYSYRASKCALNMLTKTAAVELTRKKKPVILVSLHPGTVNTDLSRPFHKNYPPEKIFPVTRAVSQLMGLIDGLQPQDSGSFIAWDGQRIPW